MRLINGVFTIHEKTFDLTQWRIARGQRAFIQINAFEFLMDIIEKSPEATTILIIDEFRPPEVSWQRNHLSPPRDLMGYIRDYGDMAEFYKNAGKHLLYFASYAQTVRQFLEDSVVEHVKSDIDKRFEKVVTGKEVKLKPGLYLCLYYIGNVTGKRSRKSIKLHFPTV